MTPELERAEHAALRVQWSALTAYDCFVEAVAGWTVLGCRAAPDHPWLNQVVGDGPGLAEALGVLAGAGVRRVQVQALHAPERFAAEPPLLRLVARTGGPAAHTSLRIAVVGPDRSGEVDALARAGFGDGLPDGWRTPVGAPGWTQVVAYDGDEPVATAALHVAGRTGWLGAATTVPVARGRGAQAALVAHRLRLAAQQGAERVVAKAAPGSTSARNLERAGFVVAYPVVQRRGPVRG